MDTSGRTCLHNMLFTIRSGDEGLPSCLQAFTSMVDVKKQILSIRDIEGWGLLHLAALTGDYPAVQMFLERGMEAGAEGEYGETPINLAMQGAGQVNEKVLALLRSS